MKDDKIIKFPITEYEREKTIPNSLSLEAQQKLIKEYAEKNNIEVMHEKQNGIFGIKSDVVYGYKYDKETNELVVDEKQEKNVKEIMNLYVTYGFNSSEISQILNGVSIYKIISHKILNIYTICQLYNKKIGSKLIEKENFKIDVESILRNRDNINENLIKCLNESKEGIRNINSTMKESLLEDVDTIIKIINNLDELAKKYPESNEVLKEYYELIKEEKKYFKKYNAQRKVDVDFDIWEREYVWRNIDSYKDLQDVVNSDKAMNLLRFEDYYVDEYSYLIEEYRKIDLVDEEVDETQSDEEIDETQSDEELDEIYSDEYMQELLNSKETPEKIKDCIKILNKCNGVCERLYRYLMENKVENKEKNINEIFGNVKKCAIFVHYSVNDEKRIKEKQEKLEKFCKETLKTDNYEVFLEIESFLGERKTFNEMLKRFEDGEFSHLLVTDIGQIYKLSYDMDKALNLVDKIQDMDVTIISVDEKRVVAAKSELQKKRDKFGSI